MRISDWSSDVCSSDLRIAKSGRLVLCPQLRRNELPAWLDRRLSAHGLSASAEAVEVLVERVEGNLLAAAQEVDKLALLAPGARLDATAMAQAVADSARYNVFGLLESALAGDRKSTRLNSRH